MEITSTNNYNPDYSSISGKTQSITRNKHGYSVADEILQE